MYGLSFDKIRVIIACCEDIYGCHCIKKSNNDHFQPLFAIIVFKIKDCHFLLSEINKHNRGSLYW